VRTAGLTAILVACFAVLVLALDWDPDAAMWTVAFVALGASAIGMLVLVLVAEDPREVIQAYLAPDRTRVTRRRRLRKEFEKWWRR
jgi:hypothetical protein